MEKVNSKYHAIQYLHTRLKEAGIENYNLISNFRYKWLAVMEKNGRLVCPRGGTGMKNRLFTKEQVDEIIECFKPGGKGSWSYLDK
jgi:molybdopterin biosynthesis enzyme MoaB